MKTIKMENLKEIQIINIILFFAKFEEEIKKRETLVFTSEEGKWYIRLKRAIENIEFNN